MEKLENLGEPGKNGGSLKHQNYDFSLAFFSVELIAQTYVWASCSSQFQTYLSYTTKIRILSVSATYLTALTFTL